MKISRFPYVVILIALLAVLLIPNFASAKTSASTGMLDEAHKLAVEAQQTKGELPQGKAFQDAISMYRDVMSKYPKDDANVAKAMLELGQIYAGVPVGQTPPSSGELKSVYKSTIKGGFPFYKDGKLQNDSTARDEFNQIIAKFDGQRSSVQLEKKYGVDGAKAIDDAIQYKKLIDVKIDKRNSKGIPYKIMDSLVRLTGKNSYSYWIAIILITLIVKVITTPLTKAQFKNMREMQKLQPLIKQLQEKYKGDQKVLGEKMMELYKEHGVNPLAGCLPLLVQMPILIGLYYTIRSYEIQFAHGTFLWIGWPALVHQWAFHLPFSGRIVWFSAKSLAEPDLILLVLYTISMVISQRLSAVDPTQADQMKMMSIMMPIMFFVLIGYLPSAFMLYWFIFNLLQTWQQYHVIHGGPALVPAAPTEEEPTPEPERVRPSQRRRRRR